MKKRIIPILLVAMMFCQCCASAAKFDLESLIDKHMTHLIDMDRVYKYDYMEYEADVEEEVQEVYKYHNAVNAVLTLGLMEKLPGGFFSEQEAVPFKTFANIIMKLTIGSNVELEEQYELYPDTQYTTFNDAAYYLVGAVGYDAYERKQKGDNPRIQIAHQIGLTDGVSFVGEKNITRGELAQMLFNALQIDMVEQTVYGKTEEFGKVQGMNLLSEKFNVSLVYGTVTAQNGLNLYSEEPLERNTISIDRTVYQLKENIMADILGYQVQAIVWENDLGAQEVLGLTIDERNTTIAIALDGNVYANSSNLYYVEEGKEKKRSLSSLERIMLNDEAVSSQELSKVIGSLDGEIRFAKTQRSGSYNLAVVRSWSSYVVKSASTIEEKIYLDFGATFKSNDFVDVNEEKNVTIIKDGVPIGLENVAVGSVIDVIENRAGDAVTIIVSDKKINGTIMQRDDDTVSIDGKQYFVSSAFENVCVNNPELSDLVVGESGEFLLNNSGKIVGFSSAGDDYTLGLLKNFGLRGNGLNVKTVIKVFTEDNEWRELELADKLTLDGISNVTALDACTAMETYRDNICYAPVRFELNTEEKVKFLDTAIVNDSERNDPDSIVKAVPWSGKTNWTTTAKATWSSFTDSKYSFTNETVWMVIPTDPTREKDYTISTKHYLNWNQYIVTDLYNADDFWSVDIVVKHGTSAAGVLFENRKTYMFFIDYAVAVNDEGEDIYKVRAYAGGTGKYENKVFTVEDPAIMEQVKTYSTGDIIHYSDDSMKINRMELWCPVEDIKTKDITDVSYSSVQDELGTVVEVDAKRQMVKVNINNVESVWKITNSGVPFLFDLDTGEGIEIKPDDIRPGDRILGIADYNLASCVIIR